MLTDQVCFMYIHIPHVPENCLSGMQLKTFSIMRRTQISSLRKNMVWMALQSRQRASSLNNSLESFARGLTTFTGTLKAYVQITGVS